MAFKITTITAFVAVGPDGEEGIVGAKLGATWMPLVCADEQRVRQMYPLAVQACNMDKKAFKVIQWQEGKDITAAIEKLYGE